MMFYSITIIQEECKNDKGDKEKKENKPIHFIRAFVPEILFLIFRTAEAILEPSIIMYIYQATCTDQLHHSRTVCNNLKQNPELENSVQEIAGHIITWFRFFWDFPGLLVLPFCGAWIDQIGRKFAIVLPCVGTILAILCYLLSTIKDVNFVPLIMIGSFLRSFSGGASVVILGILSYISDTSTETARTSRIGIILSINSLGNVIGYGLLGILFDIFDFGSVFCVVMALEGVCLLGALFLFKDVMTRKEEGKSSFVFSLKHLKDSFKVVYKQREGGKRWKLLCIIITLMINQICREGERDVLILYVSRRPLNWKKSMFGYLQTILFACMGLLTSLLLPFLSYKLMCPDILIAMIGIIAKIINVLLLAFSHTTWMVFLASILGTPIAMTITAMTSLISKTVEPDEIGKVLAMTQFGEKLSSVIGAMGYPLIYSAVAAFFPGLPFLINCLLYSIALVILIVLACSHYNNISPANGFASSAQEDSVSLKSLTENRSDK